MIENIKSALFKNPALLLKEKQKFENIFGEDQKTRTKKQWRNLVRVYGKETVCKKERMTLQDVNRKIRGKN